MQLNNKNITNRSDKLPKGNEGVEDRLRRIEKMLGIPKSFVITDDNSDTLVLDAEGKEELLELRSEHPSLYNIHLGVLETYYSWLKLNVKPSHVLEFMLAYTHRYTPTAQGRVVQVKVKPDQTIDGTLKIGYIEWNDWVAARPVSGLVVNPDSRVVLEERLRGLLKTFGVNASQYLSALLASIDYKADKESDYSVWVPAWMCKAQTQQKFHIPATYITGPEIKDIQSAQDEWGFRKEYCKSNNLDLRMNIYSDRVSQAWDLELTERESTGHEQGIILTPAGHKRAFEWANANTRGGVDAIQCLGNMLLNFRKGIVNHYLQIPQEQLKPGGQECYTIRNTSIESMGVVSRSRLILDAVMVSDSSGIILHTWSLLEVLGWVQEAVDLRVSREPKGLDFMPRAGDILREMLGGCHYDELGATYLLTLPEELCSSTQSCYILSKRDVEGPGHYKQAYFDKLPGVRLNKEALYKYRIWFRGVMKEGLDWRREMVKALACVHTNTLSKHLIVDKHESFDGEEHTLIYNFADSEGQGFYKIHEL